MDKTPDDANGTEEQGKDVPDDDRVQSSGGAREDSEQEDSNDMTPPSRRGARDGLRLVDGAASEPGADSDSEPVPPELRVEEDEAPAPEDPATSGKRTGSRSVLAPINLDPQGNPPRVPIEPPPPGAPAQGRSEVARWVVSWSEPLLSDQDRTTTSADMARFIDRNSDWSCAYVAGVLHDLARSLPDDDPWRHLGALIDLDQVATGLPTKSVDKRLARRSETAPLPALTGALAADGRPFGTRRDAIDLVAAGVDDSTTDEGLAALATNLSPLSAALVAFASHDARTLHYVIGQVYHHLWLAHFGSLIEESAGRALLDSAGAAIRWLIHRRRAYTGPDDNYPTTIGLAWIAKADRVNGGTNILAELGLADQIGGIRTDEYRYLTGVADDDNDDDDPPEPDDDF